MSQGTAYIEAEEIIVAIRDVNGLEFKYKLPHSRVLVGINQEYEDIYVDSFAPRYTFPTKREVTFKINY